MIQEWRLVRMQYKPLQIDGAGEEGERGRDRRVGPAGKRARILVGIDFEGMEEWERFRIGLRESLNINPAVVHEVEVLDSLGVRKEQLCSADRSTVVGDYIKRSFFGALEEIFYVVLALWKDKGP